MRPLLKILTIILIMSVIPLKALIAQGGVTEAPNHDVYDRTENKTRKPLSYVHVREADVMWHKTVWRTLDMRQKMNLPFYHPFQPKNGRKNFMTIVKEAIRNGEITVYENVPKDSHFSTPLSIDGAMAKFTDTVVVEEYDEAIDDYRKVKKPQAVETRDVYKLDIKEQWFFDKERSMMDVRIIGIRPKWFQPPEEGETKTSREPLFWIYYPEARDVFVQAPVFNRHNDAQRLTYEDIFAKRMFDSNIYKESNVYDRLINDYKLGMDALLESKRIKQEMREFENDLWEY